MPHKTIVYLSGPMSNQPDFNFPAFDMAAKELRERGYRVINPADFGAKDRHTWRDCLCRDLAMLAHVDLVATLPNAHLSKGANLEVRTAEELGIAVRTLYELLVLDHPNRYPQDSATPAVETKSRIRKLYSLLRRWLNVRYEPDPTSV